MSEGYEGNTRRACATGGTPGADTEGRGRSAGGGRTAADRPVIPFLGHVFGVSGSLRDELHARCKARTGPDGWMRHA
ncbi:hypothetical protein GCM10010254_07500 [Streptomyces chromofuscus]|nr:hypothetical protein GCM10010254_07500 [Streptomyces chromofuscus]